MTRANSFTPDVCSACNATFILCVRVHSSAFERRWGQLAQGQERGGQHAMVAIVLPHLPASQSSRSSRASRAGGCSLLLYSLVVVYEPDDREQGCLTAECSSVK